MVRKTLLMLAVASLGTFGLVACSDDTGGQNGDSQDAGAEDMTAEDMGGETSELCSGGEGAACSCVRDEFISSAPATCSDSSQPSRCGENVITFDNWGPSSVITDLTLPSPESDIGYDMDNADGVDNALPGILRGIGQVGNIDIGAEIKNSLLSGELILLAEHQGLSDLQSSGTFQSNFMFGAPADESAQGFISKVESGCMIGGEESCELEGSVGESFLANSESFEMGVYPQAFVGDATIEDGKLRAGPGKILLSIAAPQIGQIELQLNGATITADVDSQNSSIGEGGQGVTLTNGQLGGYVRARQIYQLGNSLLSTCDCLGNPDAAFDLPDDPETEICSGDNTTNCESISSCRDSVNPGNCGEGDGQICAQSSFVCGGLPPIVSQAMDLDIDCDGSKDAVSFGAGFKAAGAHIAGVAPGIAVTDQTTDGSSVTVDEVISPESGHIVIIESGNAYEPGNALGSSAVSTGTNSDISVALDSSLSSDTSLVAVLVDDAGSMTGSYDSGDSVITYGPGIQTVEAFELRVSSQ